MEVKDKTCLQEACGHRRQTVDDASNPCTSPGGGGYETGTGQSPTHGCRSGRLLRIYRLGAGRTLQFIGARSSSKSIILTAR